MQSNFAIGNMKDTKKIVYMLDFGLSRQYINNEGNVRMVSSKNVLQYYCKNSCPFCMLLIDFYGNLLFIILAEHYSLLFYLKYSFCIYLGMKSNTGIIDE